MGPGEIARLRKALRPAATHRAGSEELDFCAVMQTQRNRMTCKFNRKSSISKFKTKIYNR
jgi:hypothetical protein